MNCKECDVELISVDGVGWIHPIERKKECGAEDGLFIDEDIRVDWNKIYGYPECSNVKRISSLHTANQTLYTKLGRIEKELGETELNLKRLKEFSDEQREEISKLRENLNDCFDEVLDFSECYMKTYDYRISYFFKELWFKLTWRLKWELNRLRGKENGRQEQESKGKDERTKRRRSGKIKRSDWVKRKEHRKVRA